MQGNFKSRANLENKIEKKSTTKWEDIVHLFSNIHLWILASVNVWRLWRNAITIFIKEERERGNKEEESSPGLADRGFKCSWSLVLWPLISVFIHQKHFVHCKTNAKLKKYDTDHMIYCHIKTEECRSLFSQWETQCSSVTVLRGHGTSVSGLSRQI